MFLYGEVVSGLLGGGSRNTFFIFSWPSLFIIALLSQLLVTFEWGARPGSSDGAVESGRVVVCMYAICKGLLAL